MTAFAVLLIILIPMAIVSIVVALLPLRSAWVRGGVLAAHVLASLGLIVLFGRSSSLIFFILGPGLAIAVIRLVDMRTPSNRT